MASRDVGPATNTKQAFGLEEEDPDGRAPDEVGVALVQRRAFAARHKAVFDDPRFGGVGRRESDTRQQACGAGEQIQHRQVRPVSDEDSRQAAGEADAATTTAFLFRLETRDGAPAEPATLSQV
jgi:hypothetical protein